MNAMPSVVEFGSTSNLFPPRPFNYSPSRAGVWAWSKKITSWNRNRLNFCGLADSLAAVADFGESFVVGDINDSFRGDSIGVAHLRGDLLSCFVGEASICFWGELGPCFRGDAREGDSNFKTRAGELSSSCFEVDLTGDDNCFLASRDTESKFSSSFRNLFPSCAALLASSLVSV